MEPEKTHAEIVAIAFVIGAACEFAYEVLVQQNLVGMYASLAVVVVTTVTLLEIQRAQILRRQRAEMDEGEDRLEFCRWVTPECAEFCREGCQMKLRPEGADDGYRERGTDH